MHIFSDIQSPAGSKSAWTYKMLQLVLNMGSSKSCVCVCMCVHSYTHSEYPHLPGILYDIRKIKVCSLNAMGIKLEHLVQKPPHTSANITDVFA